MSLINQALRKAQRDRTPERMPTKTSETRVPPGKGYPGATPREGFSPALLIGLALTVAVLIGLVVGLSIVIFKSDSKTEYAAQEITPLTPSVATGGGSAPISPAQNELITPQITPPARSQTETEFGAPNIVGELRKAREAAEAKSDDEARAANDAAEAQKTAADAAKARAEAQPSQTVVEWLGASTISGVRLAGSESRVILNGKAFSVGETVNYNLGLTVLVIQESRVLFQDSNGQKYMKRL